MANILVVPGRASIATVPIKVVPSGLSSSVGVVLTSDAAGNNAVLQTSQKTFTSTGALQNVQVPVTIPVTGGFFYVWVSVQISGISVGIWSQGDTLIAQSVEVGTIIWS